MVTRVLFFRNLFISRKGSSFRCLQQAQIWKGLAPSMSEDIKKLDLIYSKVFIDGWGAMLQFSGEEEVSICLFLLAPHTFLHRSGNEPSLKQVNLSQGKAASTLCSGHLQPHVLGAEPIPSGMLQSLPKKAEMILLTQEKGFFWWQSCWTTDHGWSLLLGWQQLLFSLPLLFWKGKYESAGGSKLLFQLGIMTKVGKPHLERQTFFSQGNVWFSGEFTFKNKIYPIWPLKPPSFRQRCHGSMKSQWWTFIVFICNLFC